ncbi:MAG: hypothetical protein JWM11_2532 [Planctomycetaceae bacterium]|nr:hypothetical protein [Planctomycetaceae bacterium]
MTLNAGDTLSFVQAPMVKTAAEKTADKIHSQLLTEAYHTEKRQG